MQQGGAPNPLFRRIGPGFGSEECFEFLGLTFLCSCRHVWFLSTRVRRMQKGWAPNKVTWWVDKYMSKKCWTSFIFWDRLGYKKQIKAQWQNRKINWCRTRHSVSRLNPDIKKRGPNQSGSSSGNSVVIQRSKMDTCQLPDGCSSRNRTRPKP